ncbi:hypothetical protein AB0N23_25185, partial [Streptomyces sp. NPDC052644]
MSRDGRPRIPGAGIPGRDRAVPDRAPGPVLPDRAHRADAPAPPGEADTAVAGDTHGAYALGKLTSVVLDALAEGATVRGGPLPGGG